MSDSEAAQLPSEASISRTLRDVVIAIHKSGNTDDLTVKRVRARAEEELGLDAGFLKSDQDWKQRSNDIIYQAVEKYCSDDPAPEPEPSPPKKAVKPKPAAKKQKPASEGACGAKRKANVPAKKSQKRRKTVSTDEESEVELSEPPAKEESPSEAESEPPKKLARRTKKVVADDSDEEEDVPNIVNDTRDGAKDEQGDDESAAVPVKEDLSDSELSSLIDESPVKKKRQKKSPPAKRQKEPKAKTTKAKTTKAKARSTKPKGDDDPDQAEIKRLQGWLVKCGIRKVWSKELAKCDTPKEKIKHLKGMLKDAGMDGKYSNEKAAKIKEAREFAKDLADIQEGEIAWGKHDDNAGRPRRRLNRGPPKVVTKDESEGDDDESSSVDDKVDEVNPESEDDSDGGDASE